MEMSAEVQQVMQARRIELAGMPDLTEEMQKRLTWDESMSVQAALVRNPKLTMAAAELLVHSPFPIIRCILARRPDLPLWLRVQLQDDPNPLVASALKMDKLELKRDRKAADLAELIWGEKVAEVEPLQDPCPCEQCFEARRRLTTAAEQQKKSSFIDDWEKDSTCRCDECKKIREDRRLGNCLNPKCPTCKPIPPVRKASFMHLSCGKGRATLAIMLNKDEGRIYVGVSFCSPKDHFRKKDGRIKAVDRLNLKPPGYYFTFKYDGDKRVKDQVFSFWRDMLRTYTLCRGGSVRFPGWVRAEEF